MYWQMDDIEINKYIELLPPEDLQRLFGIKKTRQPRHRSLKELAEAGIVKLKEGE